jgi:hypothetical protein
VTENFQSLEGFGNFTKRSLYQSGENHVFHKLKFVNGLAAVMMLGGLLLAACAPGDTALAPIGDARPAGLGESFTGADDDASATPEPTHTPETSTPEATLVSTITPTVGAEIEFTGPLTAINGNVWVVNGLNVVVTAQTEIKDNPQIGDTVKVHATLQADNSLVAREIEKETGSGGDNSGHGGGDDSGGDDNSGHGGDGDDDNSGHGGGDNSGGSDDNSGHGGGDD